MTTGVPRRRHVGAVIGAVAAAVLVVVIGVVLAFHALVGSSGHQVPKLEQLLDRIPVPTGAVLIEKTAYEANGDASAYVSRQYRLPATPTPSVQVRAALMRASVVVVANGTNVAVAAAPWSRWTTPVSGDLDVLPPGTSGGGIEVNWNGRTLTLSVRPGDVHT